MRCKIIRCTYFSFYLEITALVLFKLYTLSNGCVNRNLRQELTLIMKNVYAVNGIQITQLRETNGCWVVLIFFLISRYLHGGGGYDGHVDLHAPLPLLQI